MSAIQIQSNISLLPYNTFGLDVKARYFCSILSLNDLRQALVEHDSNAHLIIGGGSNLLLTHDFDGIVLLNRIKGKVVVHEDNEHVFIKAYSGENWHEFVLYCVEQNWGGIENLSLIPGTVGAAPMQNIGAYGVEIENVFESLEAFNLSTFETENFSKEQCRFGYRESIFKRALKDRYFIFSVTFKLSKRHVLHMDYGDIKDTLEANQIKPEAATIRDISNAVIQIRLSKLPDPKVLGNSGSFFKNPTIDNSVYAALKQKFPEIKGYGQTNGVKVPAGWLIEQCGWKGKQMGHTGSHARQALVLVNYGGATGSEVYQLALQIIDSVKEKFGIQLEPEVNII